MASGNGDVMCSEAQLGHNSSHRLRNVHLLVAVLVMVRTSLTSLMSLVSLPSRTYAVPNPQLSCLQKLSYGFQLPSDNKLFRVMRDGYVGASVFATVRYLDSAKSHVLARVTVRSRIFRDVTPCTLVV
jgi:hypothetical protein